MFWTFSWIMTCGKKPKLGIKVHGGSMSRGGGGGGGGGTVVSGPQ